METIFIFMESLGPKIEYHGNNEPVPINVSVAILSIV
jgi:hypothetical protein